MIYLKNKGYEVLDVREDFYIVYYLCLHRTKQWLY